MLSSDRSLVRFYRQSSAGDIYGRSPFSITGRLSHWIFACFAPTVSSPGTAVFWRREHPGAQAQHFLPMAYRKPLRWAWESMTLPVETKVIRQVGQPAATLLAKLSLPGERHMPVDDSSCMVRTMPITEYRYRTDSDLSQQVALDYSVLTDLCAIAALSAEWDELLARSRCNRAFSCSKWYLATPYLLPHLEPLVLVARRC